MRKQEILHLIHQLMEAKKEASQEAKAKAKELMIDRYGKGRVTFESNQHGHFVEHDDRQGDTYGHTFHPETGKIRSLIHI
jgi:hypothetical protein